MKELAYAIVGCGGAGVDVANALDQLPDARLVAVFDASRQRAAAIGTARDARVYDTLDELLRDDLVDIVYVALPHDALAPTSMAAMRAGRDVLVEKPAATNAADAAELARVAESLGRVIGVMFEFRTSAPVVEARELLASGDFGKVVAVRISTVIDKPGDYWRSGPTGLVVDSWRASRSRAGGGVVLMNSIHQLDAMRFITGLEVVRAAGEVATFSEGVEVEDTAGAVLRLDNSAICTLTAEAHSPGARGQETISIDCTRGRLDLPDPYGSNRLQTFLAEPSLPGQWRESTASAGSSHVAHLRQFTESIRNRAPAPATAWDAANALATVEAVYESARSGRTVEVVRYPR